MFSRTPEALLQEHRGEIEKLRSCVGSVKVVGLRSLEGASNGWKC
jgi:hypothetical protein